MISDTCIVHLSRALPGLCMNDQFRPYLTPLATPHCKAHNHPGAFHSVYSKQCVLQAAYSAQCTPRPLIRAGYPSEINDANKAFACLSRSWLALLHSNACYLTAGELGSAKVKAVCQGDNFCLGPACMRDPHVQPRLGLPPVQAGQGGASRGVTSRPLA